VEFNIGNVYHFFFWAVVVSSKHVETLTRRPFPTNEKTTSFSRVSVVALKVVAILGESFIIIPLASAHPSLDGGPGGNGVGAVVVGGQRQSFRDLEKVDVLSLTGCHDLALAFMVAAS
jgi:hypothetical protein